VNNLSTEENTAFFKEQLKIGTLKDEWEKAAHSLSSRPVNGIDKCYIEKLKKERVVHDDCSLFL
jgi:hypothetical protein